MRSLFMESSSLAITGSFSSLCASGRCTQKS
jgi:hypothetical protein